MDLFNNAMQENIKSCAKTMHFPSYNSQLIKKSLVIRRELAVQISQANKSTEVNMES